MMDSPLIWTGCALIEATEENAPVVEEEPVAEEKVAVEEAPAAEETAAEEAAE